MSKYAIGLQAEMLWMITPTTAKKLYFINDFMPFKRIILVVFMLMAFHRMEGQERLLRSISPELYEWNHTDRIGESQILPAYGFFRNEGYNSKNVREVKKVANIAGVQHVEISEFDTAGRIIEFDYIHTSDSLSKVKDSLISYRYTFHYDLANQVSIRFDSLDANQKKLEPVELIHMYYGKEQRIDSALSWEIRLEDTIARAKYTTYYDSSDRLLKVIRVVNNHTDSKVYENIIEQYSYITEGHTQPEMDGVLMSLTDKNKITNKSVITIIKNELNIDNTEYKRRSYITIVDSIKKVRESVCLYDDVGIYLKTPYNNDGDETHIKLQINYTKKKCRYKYLFENDMFGLNLRQVAYTPPAFDTRVESLLCNCLNKSRFCRTENFLGNGVRMSHTKQKGRYNRRNLISKVIDISIKHRLHFIWHQDDSKKKRTVSG